MTVIPFPNAPIAEPIAFAIGARVDLRVGALAGGVVRARGDLAAAFAYSSLARLLRAARMAWRERGAHARLLLHVPAELCGALAADLLDDAAVEAGGTQRNFGFELEERALGGGGARLADELRAQGWSISLAADPACPLPFGARARALYSEIVISMDGEPDPFLALEGGDRSLLGQRILAAKEAGLLVTAAHVRDAAEARKLAIAGFDRGGGPFAEAALR